MTASASSKHSLNAPSKRSKSGASKRSKNQLADARAKKKAKVEGHKTNSTADVTHTKSSWWAGGRQKGTTNREPRKTKATAAEALASAGDSEVFRSPIDNKRISKAPASFSQEGRPSRAGQRAAGGKHQQPELDKHLKRKGANCSQSACDTEEKLNEAPTELDRTDSAGKLTNDKDISTLMPQCPNIPSCSKEAEEPPLFLWRGGSVNWICFVCVGVSANDDARSEATKRAPAKGEQEKENSRDCGRRG